MNTSTIVMQTERVKSDPHYRTTLSGPDVASDIFIEVRTSWQVGHEHHFSDLDRSGSAVCHGCGATAWCEAWVADGWQGAATHAWADSLYRAFASRAEADARQVTALKHLAAQINSTRTAAKLDASEPAKIAKRSDTLFEVMTARAKARTVQPANPRQQPIL